MSLRTALRGIMVSHSGISALVGNRIYPDWIPQTGTLPCITYSLITDVPGIHLSAHDGTATARAQIDIYATTIEACDQIASAVFLALGGFSGTFGGVEFFRIKKDSERDLSDLEDDGSDQSVFRIETDYVVRYRTSIPTF